MTSDRLATARRLELTSVVEAGDRIEGSYSGVKVSIEDHDTERTLRFTLDRPVRWVSVGPRTKEINDPDVVVTGDVAFDDAVCVLAEDGFAPTVTRVFDTPAIRAAVRDLFARHPFATLQGATLTVPHVGLDKNETAAALDRGAKLFSGLRVAIDASPAAPREAAPVLDHDFPVPVVAAEAPDPRDRLPASEDPGQWFLFAALIAPLLAIPWFKPYLVPVTLGAWAVIGGLYLWARKVLRR